MRQTLLTLLILLSAQSALGQSDEEVVMTRASIVNGTAVYSGTWREVVAFRVYTLDCTGILLSPDLVLTAGHCVANVESPEEFMVFVGDRVAKTKSIPVVEMGVHPKFCGRPDCGEETYDLAYLRLGKSVCVDKGFPEILVDPDEAFEALAPGIIVTLVGFGITGEGEEDLTSWGVKRRVDVEISDISELGYRFSTSGGDWDSCNGDSGGPAFVQLDDGQWRLAGVLSAGSGSYCGSGSYYSTTTSIGQWLEIATGFDVTDRSVDSLTCELQDELSKSASGCTIAHGNMGIRAGGLWLAGVILWIRHTRIRIQRKNRQKEL